MFPLTRTNRLVVLSIATVAVVFTIASVILPPPRSPVSVSSLHFFTARYPASPISHSSVSSSLSSPSSRPAVTVAFLSVLETPEPTALLDELPFLFPSPAELFPSPDHFGPLPTPLAFSEDLSLLDDPTPDQSPSLSDPTAEPSVFPEPSGYPLSLNPSLDDDHEHISHEHVAHAVPGRAYTVYDLDGDGVELVQLDASRSHSHYYNPGPDPSLGEIILWQWYDVDTADVLADASTPFLQFPIGVTTIGLRVEDNFGNKHHDTTTVTVKPSSREGVYCYFYDHAAPDGYSISVENNIVNGIKPVYGEELQSIDFSSTESFPSIVSADAFQVRCTFSVNSAQPGPVDFSVAHYGPIRMLREIPGGHDVVMESYDWGNITTSTVYDLPVGVNTLQIIYVRLEGAPGLLRLLDAPAELLHNLALQLPLISSLSPPNSTLSGGGRLTVTGTGFWNDPNVYFGSDVILSPDPDRSTTEMLSVIVPPTMEAGDVNVTIGNKFGGSNALTFTYAEDALIPIKFEETRLMSGGETFKLKLITNLVYGPDHRLYLASLDSFVYSLEVSKELSVSNICQSNSLGNLRTVVGLAFNPAISEPIVYASSSIFYWGTSGLDGDFLWANGQVSVLKPNVGGACLGVVGGPIITGLPVSNHDHGVNNLLFDDDGLLHFQVGAATNAGVPAESIGGIDESPLSAASLTANIYAPGFDGNVVYDSSDPGTANQISGDVEVFAPGWRNSFDLTLHSNGFMYATDNGANAEFGNRSTSCEDSAQISPYFSDDKLAKLISGKYGGHANRNRGRTDPIQCTWRNPFEEATDNYLPPIATFQSSTDGILEYTADLFGGQLKGDLLASKYSTNDPNNNGRVYRVQLDENGERLGDVDVLWEGSGLSIEMTPWGDILMPRLYEEEIMALRAVQEGAMRGRLISVTPFRGPAAGGNEVFVTVTGLGIQATAVFNGRECMSIRERTEYGFKCVVPHGQGAGSVRVGIRIGEGVVVYSERGFDYRYMRI